MVKDTRPFAITNIGSLTQFFAPILPSVPFSSRLMFSRCMNYSSSVSIGGQHGELRCLAHHRKIGVMALAVSAENDE